MSRIRLYIDEDAMDGDFVRGLRSRGIDVVTAFDAGMVCQSDESHLRAAIEQDRTLYSFNIRDFHQIHSMWLAKGWTHAGVILSQQKRYSTGEQIRRMLRLIGSVSAESMTNREEFLGGW
ncbi:MAG: DUF5615 family PIN-like protein [Bryobacteraceae bacterium]